MMISVRLPEHLIVWLDGVVAGKKLSRSAFFQEALEAFSEGRLAQKNSPHPFPSDKLIPEIQK